MFSSATTPSSIRGYSINLVYLDELAFVQNDIRFYESTYPVIASGTTSKIIITSTPLGMNLFYKLWTDAVNQKNSYKSIEVLWNRHPERDDAWKKETIKNTSQKQFDQEHNCCRGDSIVTIRNKKTGIIENIKIEDLYQELENK